MAHRLIRDASEGVTAPSDIDQIQASVGPFGRGGIVNRRWSSAAHRISWRGVLVSKGLSRMIV